MEFGQFDRAVADYAAAIERAPNDAVIVTNRAKLHERQSRWDRGKLTDYWAALELDPKNAALYSDRGWAYYQQKQYEKATADFDEAIRLDPAAAKPYNRRAIALESLGQFDKSLADYTAAIRAHAETIAGCRQSPLVARKARPLGSSTDRLLDGAGNRAPKRRAA